MYLDPICTYTLKRLCPRFVKGLIWLSSILALNSGTRYLASVDCLQFAFSQPARLETTTLCYNKGLGPGKGGGGVLRISSDGDD